MREAEVRGVFREIGAMLQGHFLLTSGLHSPVYWEKFRLLHFPHQTVRLCRMIASHFRDRRVDVVAGPTTGGIILAFEVARQLRVRSVFAEKEGGRRVFRRSLTVDPRERVLVVDDVLTTGGSVREVIDAVGGLGGVVAGVSVLVDRSEAEIDFGAELFSCLRAPTPAYAVERCPLCAAGLPLVSPGRGSA